MWLTGSAELPRFQFMEKMAICTRTMKSNSHSGANSWSENESVSVKHDEADDLYLVLRCISALKREGKN